MHIFLRKPSPGVVGATWSLGTSGDHHHAAWQGQAGGPDGALLHRVGGGVSGAFGDTVALSVPRSPGCFSSQWAPPLLRP